MRNQRASYWQYDGNHYDGHDCARYNSHGLKLNVIAYAAGCAQYQSFHNDELNRADIKVIHEKGNDFGHVVWVHATPPIWEKIKEDYQKELEIERGRLGLWKAAEKYND